MKPTSVVSASADVTQPASGQSLQRGLRQGYVLVSALLALAILFQVFLAGGGLFAEPGWWPTHQMLGMALSAAPLLLLALGIAARLPGRLLWLNGLLLVLVALQPFLISAPEQWAAPTLKSLHVVNALLMFALTALLGQQVWQRLTRPFAVAFAAASEQRDAR
ncbi:MAG TPA: DUF6220 domain-containing protein [Ktedonobacterales bacterium]|jgi:hypothetical protein